MIHDVHKKLLLRSERQKQNREKERKEQEEENEEEAGGVKEKTQVEMTIKCQQEVDGNLISKTSICALTHSLKRLSVLLMYLYLYLELLLLL